MKKNKNFYKIKKSRNKRKIDKEKKKKRKQIKRNSKKGIKNDLCRPHYWFIPPNPH